MSQHNKNHSRTPSGASVASRRQRRDSDAGSVKAGRQSGHGHSRTSSAAILHNMEKQLSHTPSNSNHSRTPSSASALSDGSMVELALFANFTHPEVQHLIPELLTVSDMLLKMYVPLDGIGAIAEEQGVTLPGLSELRGKLDKVNGDFVKLVANTSSQVNDIKQAIRALVEDCKESQRGMMEGSASN
ncbi:uncharacterized protein FOMMEDRAFT_159337 [Fomitiporia mediterranea MF3/22]|uniref:uncharacterized protein n=1 Tax=Fomitiporia mediterranea (strain MF3/22) TaxID=694068 RepID=UPI00044082C0|nr:uncharacterized protein FOMMEDRAFT_159337 [Fomitiporia mediterranea MF3/22]EJD00589.1 hypothetical protein FOMMEDRAFT_159337 [Fomitiporia mediterranea MF3/22]